MRIRVTFEQPLSNEQQLATAQLFGAVATSNGKQWVIFSPVELTQEQLDHLHALPHTLELLPPEESSHE